MLLSVTSCRTSLARDAPSDSRTAISCRRATAAPTRIPLTFEHAIIATGSRPATVPGLSLDSDRVMDSTAALDLPDIPKSLLVVGGGYIGLELGSVYAALGTKVTVVEMTPGLLPGADRDLVTYLARRMEGTMHKVLTSARVVEMKEAGGKSGGIQVRIEGDNVAEADRTQTFDRVLVSVGRKPNSQIDGLDRIGVKVGEPGERHKESFRTAGASAAAGGVTTIVTRPDTLPAVDTPETLEFLQRRAVATSPVKVLPMAALTKGRDGREMTEIGFLMDAGAVALLYGREQSLFQDGFEP